jgi:hypothetical protein
MLALIWIKRIAGPIEVPSQVSIGSRLGLARARWPYDYEGRGARVVRPIVNTSAMLSMSLSGSTGLAM